MIGLGSAPSCSPRISRSPSPIIEESAPSRSPAREIKRDICIDWVDKFSSRVAVQRDDDYITQEFKHLIKERIHTLMGSQPSSYEVRILMNDDFSISRVPTRLRRSKEAYYEPSVVSIGPYHRGKKGLEAMEEYKWCHLKSFLNRKFKVDGAQVPWVDNCIDLLVKYAPIVRMFYFEYIHMRDDELVEMLLLDGCFIVDTILSYYDQKHSITRSSSWFTRQIWEDLLLFENQIPFFILEKLHSVIQQNKEQRFIDVVKEYMNNRLLPMEMKNDRIPLESKHISHLLQLFYCFTISEPVERDQKKISIIKQIVSLRWLNPLRLVSFLISYKRSSSSLSYSTIHKAIKIPTATKLKDAGITFKAKVPADNFMDITFDEGILEIPPIILDSQRKCRMMNLISFEQSNKIFNTEMLTSYAEFMDNIIDTDNDVEILQRAGIIVSYLWNNAEVAIFFNQLSEHKAISYDHMLSPVMRQIKEYAEVNWHRWRAYLKGHYFRNPWSIISLIAAGVLLILTALQTAYTMNAYYFPPSPRP